MDRAEARRRGKDDHVAACVDRLLIGVEAGKLAIIRDVNAIVEAGLQFAKRVIEAILEQVRHSDNLHRLFGAEAVPRGAAAAPAAADQRDLHGVAAGGMCGLRDAKRAGQCAAGHDDARGFQKVTPRGLPGGGIGWFAHGFFSLIESEFRIRSWRMRGANKLDD